MGLERRIRIPVGTVLEWSSLTAKLTDMGLPVVVRMIDGMPAFPDEVPTDDWREVRFSLAEGMVTVRRFSEGVRLLVWGSADEALLRSRDRCAEAIADVFTGTIEADE